MNSKHILRRPKFFSKAHALRKEFETLFENPKQTAPERFQWDYWFVEDQYTLIRAQAESIFSESLFLEFQKALVDFGRTHLGCDAITPPWISYYVDGCSQQLHADVPHGPWAYVFSLTPWQNREFTGGETLLLKPQTLNYWSHFESMGGIEMNQLTEKIPALFNQLLVFDPRIPHGVVPVRGTQDPLKARLVLHGWFTHPQPMIEGALASAKTQKRINDLILSLEPIYSQYPDLSGGMTVRFKINANGKVSDFSYLTNTLVSVEHQPFDSIFKDIKKNILQTRFPKSTGLTRVTIPFLFQSV